MTEFEGPSEDPENVRSEVLKLSKFFMYTFSHLYVETQWTLTLLNTYIQRVLLLLNMKKFMSL